MQVLVTGATGLLGNNIVRQLLEQSHQVHVLVRPQSDPRPLNDLPVERREGDVTDPASIRRAIATCEAVIHSAGYVKIGWQNESLHEQINVEGARNVAEAARSAHARLVHVSTINSLGLGRKDRLADEQWAAPGITLCPYVIAKRRAEELVAEEVERGLHATIVHPGFMLGPWDWKPSSGEMLLQVAGRWTPVAPVGGMSCCDVRDVAAATIAAIERGRSGEHYVLAGENLTYFQLWKRMAAITGSRPPRIPAGPLLRWLGGAFGDVVSRFSSQESDVNSAAVKLSSQIHFFSSAKAESELGYHPRPLDESIRDAWQWFQEYGYA